MRGAERRLGALEGAYDREPCEECGLDGDLSNIEVTWDDLDGLEEPRNREPEPDPHPEWCGTCGRQTVYIITWEDIPDAETMRRRQGGRLN